MDAAADQSAMTPPAVEAGNAPPAELTPRQQARIKNLPPEAQKVIAERKLEAAKAAAPETPAVKDKPKAKVDPKDEDELPPGVIDFATGEEKKPAEGDEEFPAEDVVIEGLNADGQKRLKELNHKAQTFRKRTQEAEKTAKEAADKITAAEKRAQELESELGTLRTAPRSGNWYASVTDERHLAQIEALAQAGLNQLKKVLKGDENAEFTFLDGSKRDLTVDDLDLFTTAIDQVEQQRESLGKLKGSQQSAASIIEKMKGVDGYDTLHKAAQSADWDYDRPTLAAKLAVAELALSGKYVLMPRGSRAISEKAPAAKSAGNTSTSEMAPPSGSQKKAPPQEIAGTMPAATRGRDFDSLLSSAQARAAKGDQSAIRDILRLKRERRQAEQQAA